VTTLGWALFWSRMARDIVYPLLPIFPVIALQELQQARRGVLEAIQAHMDQIRAARGDINVFRARFRAVTAAGDTAQDLGRLGPRLDELLTP
jgi:hypothetical protein